MKKRLLLVFTLLMVIGICTACNGDVTRDLRHAGYSVSETPFVCDAFFGEESTEQIRFLAGDKAITYNGVIYELSIGKKFSNNQNCRVADTGLRVSALFDDNVFLATNGGIYTLTSNGQSPAYTEITSADNSYSTYATLFYSGSGVKYNTVDSNNGIYYSLHNDGNVYGYTLYKGERESNPVIAGVVVVYNKMDYGNIIDFRYAGNSPQTYVRTDDSFYHLTATNLKECSTYADIQCSYVMSDDEILEKNKDYLFAYNGSMIITTYKKIFTLSSSSE